MNKASLTQELKKIVSTRKEAQQVLEAVFSYMRVSLRAGQKVVISDFGSFHPRIRKARKARNIKTGETVYVPSRRVIKFNPAKYLLVDKS